MADINKALSTYHLSTGTERNYQPGKKNFFEFVVEDLGDLLKPGIEEDLAEDQDYILNGQEIIRIAVHETSVPHFELATLSIRKGNSVVKYAGVPTFNEGTLVCTDLIGAQSKAVLEAWQNLAYNVVTDKGGRAYTADGRGYKRNATLIEYTSDHVRVRSWKLIGCWISNITEENYNQETDDIQRVTCTIQYDRAIPEIENV